MCSIVFDIVYPVVHPVLLMDSYTWPYYYILDLTESLLCTVAELASSNASSRSVPDAQLFMKDNRLESAQKS